jgi:hypothetical protein
MGCPICESGNQGEFTAEVNVHFPGPKRLDDPGVFLFPKLLVCLDCGFSRFATPKPELALLAKSAATSGTRRSVLKMTLSVSEPLRRVVGD